MRSGRMCSRNRPGNTITVSYASEPQMSAVMRRRGGPRFYPNSISPSQRDQRERQHYRCGARRPCEAWTAYAARARCDRQRPRSRGVQQPDDQRARYAAREQHPPRRALSPERRSASGSSSGALSHASWRNAASLRVTAPRVPAASAPVASQQSPAAAAARHIRADHAAVHARSSCRRARTSSSRRTGSVYGRALQLRRAPSAASCGSRPSRRRSRRARPWPRSRSARSAGTPAPAAGSTSVGAWKP